MIDSKQLRHGLPILVGTLLVCACTDPPPVVSTRSAAVPVRSAVLERGDFRGELTVLGVLRPAETVPVTTAGGGIVDYPPRFARGLRTGERVAAGETLAVLDSSTVRLVVAEALLNAESDRAELERAQAGYDAGLISRAELDKRRTLGKLSAERLKSAREEVARLQLIAPRGGRLIVDRTFPPATQLAPGTTLAHVAVNGPPRVEGSAAAADRSRLRAGLTARFVAPGADAPCGRGVVREVSPVVDAGGTVRVILGVTSVAGATEEETLPAPGEGVEVHIELRQRKDVLTVPLEALTIWSGGHAVFVLDRNEARRVRVQLGDRNDDRVEIVDGLREGDRIAVAGVSLLTDGSAVAEAAPRVDPAGAPDAANAGSE